MNTLSTEKIRVQLAEKLGINALPQKRQEEVADKVTEALLKMIFIETVEQLSQKDRDEMGKLMDREETTPEEMEEFLRDRIDDYDNFLEGVVNNFLDELQKEAV